MALIESNQLPNIDLFGIFICHFVFSTWGISGHWSPDSYLYYNLILLIVLLWALKDTPNEVPIILGIRINAISIIFDLLILMWYFPYSFWRDLFSALGGILNFMLRFVSIPLLSKICSERTSGLNDGIPQYLIPIFGGSGDYTSRRDPYEDIDTVPHQSYPRTETVVVTGGTHSYTPKSPPPYQG